MYFFIGILLLYITIYKDTLSSDFYKVLFYLGIVFILIQLFFIYINIILTKMINKIVIFPLLLCILIADPILIYIGYKENIPDIIYTLTRFLGVFFIIYFIVHSYYIVKISKEIKYKPFKNNTIK